MPTESQISKLLMDITRRTIEGGLEWEMAMMPPPLRRGTSDIIDDYFETMYKNQKIAVYERKYRAYDGEHDESYWTSDAHLAIIQDSGAVWETSADSARIWALLKLARDSATGIDSVFEDLLRKDE